MIEVFTPRDSRPTDIDPHSLSNTMYMNKTQDTPRATMLQYLVIPVIGCNQTAPEATAAARLLSVIFIESKR